MSGKKLKYFLILDMNLYSQQTVSAKLVSTNYNL